MKPSASRAFLLAVAVAIPASAGSFADLPRYMPPGDWLFNYDRQARIRLLHYTKKEKDADHVCIGADPRRMILDWLAAKHCDIGKDALLGKSWRLSGECQVKWSQTPIPIQVEIVLGDGTSFVMDTRTTKGAFLDFQEHAVATRVAAICGKD